MNNCKEDKIKILRLRRVDECFNVVNRGKLWYNKLTKEQTCELNDWYEKWLDVTETLIVPIPPKFLSEKLNKEEILL